MLSHLSALLRYDLAIDLGTAATRMAMPGQGIVLDEPSVVAVGALTIASSPVAAPWAISRADVGPHS